MEIANLEPSDDASPRSSLEGESDAFETSSTQSSERSEDYAEDEVQDEAESESSASRHQQGGNDAMITPARQLFLQYQELVNQLEQEVKFFSEHLFLFFFKKSQGSFLSAENHEKRTSWTT